MGIALGPRPPELAFPALLQWMSGKQSGVPNVAGTDWTVPLTVGGASQYAQGPLPPQPPVEVISNGEPRLMPSVPQPRYAPAKETQASGQPPPDFMDFRLSSGAWGPFPLQQQPHYLKPGATLPMALTASYRPPNPGVAGFPFGYPPQPGSYPEPKAPPAIDPRVPAMLRSLIPGHGFTTTPQAFGLNPPSILSRSQGMPPIPPPAPPGKGMSTDDALRGMRMLRALNAPTPQGLSGFADNSMQDTQVMRDEQQRQKRLTGNY